MIAKERKTELLIWGKVFAMWPMNIKLEKILPKKIKSVNFKLKYLDYTYIHFKHATSYMAWKSLLASSKITGDLKIQIVYSCLISKY